MSDEPNKHVNETTWTKGKSGNPGGRSPRIGPNGETAAELARVHTVDAIKCLAEVTNDKTVEPRARVAAASALLDRGWGKPKESVDLTADVKSNTPVINLTVTRAKPQDDSA